MNICFCTGHMRQPFFYRAIPTYRVLPYSMIEQCREADEEEFGPASPDSINLVENFCSMHLGVNLRKAFLSGVKDTSEQTSDSGTGLRDYHQVDTLVHEFCKLFGKRSTPVYACGVVMFPDFLALKS